jgi:hypothetical protein
MPNIIIRNSVLGISGFCFSCLCTKNPKFLYGGPWELSARYRAILGTLCRGALLVVSLPEFNFAETRDEKSNENYRSAGKRHRLGIRGVLGRFWAPRVE